jgi:hypothetical protein
MRTMRTRIPTPVVLLLLVAALVVGGAAPSSAGGALSAKTVKKLVTKTVNAMAPALSVAHAASADTAAKATTATSAATADKANAVAPGSITGDSVKDGSLSGADTGVYGAHVSAAGTLVGSTVPTITATKIATGTYEVGFPRDVSGCIYSATATLGAGTTILVQPRSATPNAVWVQAANSSQAATDTNLYLTVVC